MEELASAWRRCRLASSESELVEAIPHLLRPWWCVCDSPGPWREELTVYVKGRHTAATILRRLFQPPPEADLLGFVSATLISASWVPRRETETAVLFSGFTEPAAPVKSLALLGPGLRSGLSLLICDLARECCDYAASSNCGSTCTGSTGSATTEHTLTRTDHNSTRTDHHSTRTDHHSTRTDHNLTRTGCDLTRTGYDLTRTEHTSTRTEHTLTRTEPTSTRTEHTLTRAGCSEPEASLAVLITLCTDPNLSLCDSPPACLVELLTDVLAAALAELRTSNQAASLAFVILLNLFPIADPVDGTPFDYNLPLRMDMFETVLTAAVSLDAMAPLSFSFNLVEAFFFLFSETRGTSLFLRSLLRAAGGFNWTARLSDILALVEIKPQQVDELCANLAPRALLCADTLRPLRLHREGGAGWENMGNTCFVAAAVNALFLTTPVVYLLSRCLRQYLSQHQHTRLQPSGETVDLHWIDVALPSLQDQRRPPHLRWQLSRDVPVARLQTPGLKFAWTLLKCLVEAHLTDRKCLNLSKLSQLCPFGQGSQEDVFELLQWSLNQLAALEDAAANNDTPATTDGAPASSASAAAASASAVSTPTSPAAGGLRDLFRVQQSSLLICQSCRRQHTVRDSFFAILLPMDIAEESPRAQPDSPRAQPAAAQPAAAQPAPALPDALSTASSGGAPPERRPSSVASSVYEVVSQTSSMTTRDSSLSEVSTDDEAFSTSDFEEEALPAARRDESSNSSELILLSKLYQPASPFSSPENAKWLDSETPVSLLSLLDRYLVHEELDDYTCDRAEGCGVLGRSFRQALFTRLPPVLTIVLNRFRHSGQSHKIRQPVVLSKFLALPRADDDLADDLVDYDVYQLYTVIIHSGESLHSGHYRVFGRALSSTQDTPDALWVSFDDSSVSPVEYSALASMALNQLDTPYVLFYKRLSTEVPPAEIHLRRPPKPEPEVEQTTRRNKARQTSRRVIGGETLNEVLETLDGLVGDRHTMASSDDDVATEDHSSPSRHRQLTMSQMVPPFSEIRSEGRRSPRPLTGSPSSSGRLLPRRHFPNPPSELPLQLVLESMYDNLSVHLTK